MATVELQGTSFSFSILPLDNTSDGYWAKTKIGLKNEYVDYLNVSEDFTREELQEWIFCMFRLLAGAYGSEYSLSFEKAKFAVDIYPYENGRETTRTERRENDCVMTIRLLMRSSKDQKYLGGVYSLLLHRKEIESFAVELQREFDQELAKYCKGKGKYLFAGVSPLGYNGCNYWYLDPRGETKAGDYVWVRMGRHNTEQIVHVDSVKYFGEEDAPFPPERVKQVLRKATPKEIKKLKL